MPPIFEFIVTFKSMRDTIDKLYVREEKSIIKKISLSNRWVQIPILC